MPLNHRYNRRSDFRVPLQCGVQLQSLDATASIHLGVAQNISVSGMQLLADQLYPAGSQVRLAFHCKELGWGPVSSCLASVRWIDAQPIHGQHRLGVKFEDPDWQ